ncbi:MAG: hypothetical protein WD971_09070 [Pirellulales bacterium]
MGLACVYVLYQRYEPLAREPIHTADAFTAELVDYTLAEQARVQSSL